MARQDTPAQACARRRRPTAARLTQEALQRTVIGALEARAHGVQTPTFVHPFAHRPMRNGGVERKGPPVRPHTARLAVARSTVPAIHLLTGGDNARLGTPRAVTD